MFSGLSNYDHVITGLVSAFSSYDPVILSGFSNSDHVMTGLCIFFIISFFSDLILLFSVVYSPFLRYAFSSSDLVTTGYVSALSILNL